MPMLWMDQARLDARYILRTEPLLNDARYARLAGDNTMSGANIFTGANTLSGANILSGDNVISGDNTISGDNVISGANTISGANLFTVPQTFKAPDGTQAAWFCDNASGTAVNPGGIVGISSDYPSARLLSLRAAPAQSNYIIEAKDGNGDALYRLGPGATVQAIGQGNFGGGVFTANTGFIRVGNTGDDALVFAQHGVGANSNIRLRSKGTGAVILEKEDGTDLLTVANYGDVLITTADSIANRSRLIANFNALGVRRFELGAADSGGAGYRMVRVTN